MRFSHAVKTIIIFGAGLALGLVANSFISPNEPILPTQKVGQSLQEQQEKIYVSLMVDFQDGKVITCTGQQLIEEKKTVLNLLETCSKNTENPFELVYDVHPEWGAFVKQIGNKESGKDNKYWQYWVNNEYSQVGASQFQLQDGDIVEWKFLASQF